MRTFDPKCQEVPHIGVTDHVIYETYCGLGVRGGHRNTEIDIVSGGSGRMIVISSLQIHSVYIPSLF